MNGDLPSNADLDRRSVWLELPYGYAALPLDDIPATVTRASEVLTAVGAESAISAAIVPVTRALGVFLTELADRNVMYCGYGRHASVSDGRVLTSVLIVSMRELPERGNPKLTLKELVTRMAASGEQGQTDLVDLANGPALFRECVRKVPAPTVPGLPAPAEDGTASVFQLEAHVPSGDGTKLVTIEVSTPFVGNGPEFRAMMVTMAASISFQPPTARVDTAGWGDIING